MTSVVKAFGLNKRSNSYWEPLSLTSQSMMELFPEYQNIILGIELDNELVYKDISDLKTVYFEYEGNLLDLFNIISIETLITISEPEFQNIKSVNYEDIFRAGYKVKSVKMGFNYPFNYPHSELKDIEISRENTDMTYVEKFCMVTINGYLHKPESVIDNKLHIKNGSIAMKKENKNHIGLLSFQDIGEIEYGKLTYTDILSVDDITKLSDRCYLKITKEEDESIMLVIGGYLVLLDDNVLTQHDAGILSLQLNNLPIKQRLIESINSINMDSMGINKNDINDRGIDIQNLINDNDFIKKYLTFDNSFIVKIKTNNLHFRHNHIRSSNLPGMFTTYHKPIHPLVMNYGKIGEYWKTYEDGFWSVTVCDSYYRNFVFNYSNTKSGDTVGNSLTPNRRFHNSHVYFIEINSYK